MHCTYRADQFLSYPPARIELPGWRGEADQFSKETKRTERKNRGSAGGTKGEEEPEKEKRK